MSAPSPALPPFGWSLITSHTDTAPVWTPGSFDDLYAYLQKHVRLIEVTHEQYAAADEATQKRLKNGPALIFAAFTRPGVRTDAEVAYVTALAFDVDEQHVELALLRAVLAGYSVIIYESLRSTPGRRRWRVIIELARPCSVEEYGRAFDHWARLIPGVAKQVRGASKLWYLRQRLKDAASCQCVRLAGQPWDPGEAATAAVSSREAMFKHIQLPADAPVAEGQRNSQLSRYAASVVGDCEDEAELYMTLSHKNQQYAKPLPESEVRGVARQTWGARAKLGWQRPSSPGEPASEEAAGGAVDLDALLDTDHGEVPWVVQDTLTYGAHLLVGRPKGGKSWLTMDMVLGVGNGGQFLGAQATRAQVLWIAGEDTQASLGRRLRVRGERAGGAVAVHTMETLKAERALWPEDFSFQDFLRGYLTGHPEVRLVVIDTQKTCEAIWAAEQIDRKRFASIVDVAYQDVRLYDAIGQEHRACIVLVHHAGKMKANKGADYHERINLPTTSVAGATASMVLADPDERDLNDEDDHRRVFALRGRHIIREAPLLIELALGRARRLALYQEHVQSAAQAEVFEAIEALLTEGEVTTIEAVAKLTGKHKNTVQGALRRAAKVPGGMTWKGRLLVVKPGKGLYWGR